MFPAHPPVACRWRHYPAGLARRRARCRPFPVGCGIRRCISRRCLKPKCRAEAGSGS